MKGSITGIDWADPDTPSFTKAYLYDDTPRPKWWRHPIKWWRRRHYPYGRLICEVDLTSESGDSELTVTFPSTGYRSE